MNEHLDISINAKGCWDEIVEETGSVFAGDTIEDLIRGDGDDERMQRVVSIAGRCIYNAILAERERAAKAAEQRGRELREPAIGSDIANTIREPGQP